MLPKKNRLKENHIKTIYESGKKFRGEYGMLIVKEYPNVKNPEFAFVVSKKIGNAVQRHKMTRLLREITRENINTKPETQNFRGIYVAYKYSDDYEELKKELTKHFDDAIRGIKKD